MKAPMPSNLDAEIGLLSSVLADPPQALAALRQSHPDARELFYDLSHRNIFAAASDLNSDGKAVEFVGLCSALNVAAEQKPFIAGLFNQGVASLACHHADILRPLYIRRLQIEAAYQLDQAARAGDESSIAEAVQSVAASTAKLPVAFPEIEDSFTIVANPKPKPLELVYGLLHRGSKMVLGGGSKSSKTWSLLDLSLSVAYGEPFWSLKTSRSPVLFLNLEVQPEFFSDRIKAVAEAKGIKLEPGRLEVWNLRGHAEGYKVLLPFIQKRLQDRKYGLLTLDPSYKLLGDADENSASDIGEMMNALERLARETGAAIAFSSHFAKGNASAKESIDRISGSGVFARDPDSIVTMTKHEEENAFAVEATLRNFKPLEPFVVRWQFPLMRRDGDLDPKKLKDPKGRKALYSVETILDALRDEVLPTAAWQRKAKDESGVSPAKFYELKKIAIDKRAVQAIGKNWRITPETPETPTGAQEQHNSSYSNNTIGVGVEECSECPEKQDHP